jgi:Tol biopolymer transport system component
MTRPCLRLLVPAAVLALAACGGPPDDPPAGKAPAAGAPAAPASAPGAEAPRSFSGPAKPRPSEAGEKHLKNVRQLTFGGENAEAYWSFAGDVLVFQSTRPPYAADQIYLLSPKGGEPTLVSTGLGRTTCAYFLPGDRRLLFASTHLASAEPPKPPDRSHGYAWGIFEYEIFTVGRDGKDLKRLTNSPGYDAEATVSPKGDRIVFTSSRDGDLDVYTMALDGSDVKRLTDEVGYDGGAVFSPDGTQIVYRGGHPDTDEGKAKFKALLAKGLVRPDQLEIRLMDADGRNRTQVTKNGKANFGPCFTPDGKRILFASNLDDPSGRSFDLYLVNLDGTGLERVTTFTNDKHDDFDGFPMFSPDGKTLVWCSNRFNDRPHETNVFIADWVE